ncbi:MAG: glycosyltransferase family 2 protein [Terriglobia bacterium]
MKFTLILATIHRTTELTRFLEALERQTYRDFSIVLVDQNPDDRVQPILASCHGRLSLLHLRSKPGLSRARNLALGHITGDIVAFPDDDCWYPPKLLDRVAGFFSEHPDCDGLTGRRADPLGLAAQGWDRQAGSVNKANVSRRGISFTIFLRRSVIDQVGGFDETLGVGAGTPWGACEESDYLLRALAKGCRVHYDPDVAVFHPQALEKNDGETRRKACSYARGGGRVLQKHNYPALLAWKIILTPLTGVAYSLLTGRPARALVRWRMFTGALKGYRSKPAPGTWEPTSPQAGAASPKSELERR